MVVLRNCEESESDKAIEYSEKLNSFYFPPSPTYFPPSSTAVPPSPPYFPLYSPPSPPRPSSSNSSITYVWDTVSIIGSQDFLDLPDLYLGVVVEHKIQDRGGALDVIPSGSLVKINELVQRLDDIVDSQAKNRALKYVDEECLTTDFEAVEFELLEKQNEDIIDQLVIDSVNVGQYLIQYRGGALDSNQLGNFSWFNGSEISEGQLLTSTPEPTLILQTKLSLRLWQGHRGQWVVEICYGWNWLNIGTLKTAEGSLFSSESVLRFRGGKDLFDHPFYELFVNENRTEHTTKPITENQMLELPPTEEQENLDEDFEFWCIEAMGNDVVEAEATRNDGVEAVGIGRWNGCDITPIQATVNTNSVPAMEFTPPRSSLAAQQENPDEDFVNGQVEQVGIVSEGTEEAENAEPQLNSGPSGKRKRKEKNTRERGNKKTTGVRNVIPLEEISEIKEMHLNDAARHLNVSQSTLEAVRSVGTREGEMNEAQLNSECLGNGKSNEKTPEEERSNNKTAGVRIAIALEDILQTKEMLLKDAAKHLKVSRSKLKSSCREYGIHRWPPRDEHKFVRQSLPNEIPAIVNQDGILQLISNCVPSNQPLMATFDTNSVVKEIPALWISPTARQENRNENFATDEIEVIGMRGVGTGEGEMEVDPLNSGCSGKWKTIEKTSRGDRGNNKTTGVRIAIPLEDILWTKEMRLEDAAKHLNVSRSTLKRACREYNIHRWPPREELKLLSQYSLANKSPTVVDQGQIPQLNDDMLLPSNQVPTTVSTNSTVTVKVRCGKETIKFRLSWPWETVELKQQVKKRLELEDGTYYIRYKDEDGELILIACDDDLQECISSSSPLASKSIEILLEPK